MHRENPWLYERDGDLNPTWPLVVLYCLFGLVGSVLAFISGNAGAQIAALSFLGSMIVALLISALPRDKAKILAQSRAPGEVATGIAGRTDWGYGVRTYDLAEGASDL